MAIVPIRNDPLFLCHSSRSAKTIWSVANLLYLREFLFTLPLFSMVWEKNHGKRLIAKGL